MLTILGSIITGGATGLIGTLLTSVIGYFTAKEDNKMEIRRTEEARKTQIVLANIQLKSLQLKGDIDLSVEETRQDGMMRTASYANDKAQFATGDTARNSMLFIIVDFVRGMIRPLLTIYLIILTTLVYMQAHALVAAVGVEMPLQQAVDMVQTITTTILYLTTVVVTWWFGSRTVEKHIKRKV